jgi:hypothetical protein
VFLGVDVLLILEVRVSINMDRANPTLDEQTRMA